MRFSLPALAPHKINGKNKRVVCKKKLLVCPQTLQGFKTPCLFLMSKRRGKSDCWILRKERGSRVEAKEILLETKMQRRESQVFCFPPHTSNPCYPYSNGHVARSSANETAAQRALLQQEPFVSGKRNLTMHMSSGRTALPCRLTRTCWKQQIRWRTTPRGTAGALAALLSWCAGVFSCFNFDNSLCVHAAA